MSIHPTAIVDKHAELDSDVEVGPYCVIDAHVRVARGCRLYHNVYLTGWTEIGDDCVLHPGVIVGHEPQDIKYEGQRSFCCVGQRNIIREYATIHRGTIPDSATSVGDDCFLLAGSHIGHNCTVGNHVTMINNALLAGHVTVEDHVTFGGGAGVHQFCRVGKLAMVTGNARVPKDVVPYALLDGEGRVAGLNNVGLRRAGIPRENVLELRKAFHILFGRSSSGDTRAMAIRSRIERLASVARTPEACHLLAFVKAESQRGLAGRSRRRSRGAGGARNLGIIC